MAVLHVKTPNGVTKAYDLDKLGGIPVGFEHFSMNPNVPQGWLPLLGGEYNRATYPDLWAWVQAQTGYCKTESEWQTLSAAHNGNVPFYSSGNGNTTFRVPSLKCWVKGANGNITEVGSYLEAGLPNIEGVTSGIRTSYSGAFSQTGEFMAGTLGSGFGIDSLTFDASRSSNIYGKSETVQPESIVGLWLVKAYGTIEETGTINEQQYIDEKFAQAKQYTDLRVPTGCVQAFAGNTLPNGWLLCDGSAVSRTSYATLFTAIGTIYGAGDGSTTFNLPNLTDKFIQGSGTVGTVKAAGLPDIVGGVDGHIGIKTETIQNSALYGSNISTSNSIDVYDTACHSLLFNASRWNNIYGNSNTVQPPALTMRYIIKY